MNARDAGVTEARQVLSEEGRSLALLIGNGVNLASETGPAVGWQKLVDDLIAFASQHSREPHLTRARLSSLRDRQERAASLPEIVDLAAAWMADSGKAVHAGSAEGRLQRRIVDALGQLKPGQSHQSVVGWAARLGVPVLTTNYDHSLQQAFPGEQCTQWRFRTGRRNSDYYPWDRYYAPKPISDTLCGFAVWHIHGDSAFRRSIRAGLHQYMGMVQRLRGLLSPVAEEVLKHRKRRASGSEKGVPAFFRAPWLRLLLGKKLWIQGLALSTDEVSVRWMLIQRFRYWRRYRPDSLETGWYVHGGARPGRRLDGGRRAFLQSIGLRVIEIGETDDVYSDIFGGDLQGDGHQAPDGSVFHERTQALPAGRGVDQDRPHSRRGRRGG
jgi:hypothetical protein